MRVFHLGGLVQPGDVAARFSSQFESPLILPWFIPQGNRVAITTWYAGVLTDHPLPLVEVDWDDGFLPSSALLLERLRVARGPRGAVIVVEVRGEDEDLDRVANAPELRVFEWVVLRCRCRAEHARLGRLRELAGFARNTVIEIYEAITPKLGLAGHLGAAIGRVAQVLIDPVEIINVANHAIELELQRITADEPALERAMRVRVVVEGLKALPPRSLIMLLGIALERREEAEELLEKEPHGAGRRDLEVALLLMDGAPQRWGAWIADPEVRSALGPTLASPHQRVHGWTGRVRAALGWATSQRRVRKKNEWEGLYPAFTEIREGSLEAAERRLSSLERRIEGAPPRIQGDYWDAVGRLRRERGEILLAVEAMERAIELLTRSSAPSSSRAETFREFAVLLWMAGRRARSEDAFMEAFALILDGDAGPTSVATTLRWYATVIENTGRAQDARLCLQVAALFAREGDSNAAWSGFVVQYLQLLAKAGRLAEADSVLHQLEQRGERPISKGFVFGEYARLLGDCGMTERAEQAFRSAIALKEADGAGATSRGATLGEYARLLQNAGRLSEAEPVFLEAIALKEEGGVPASSLAFTLRRYASLVQAQGRNEEAVALIERAALLRMRGP